MSGSSDAPDKREVVSSILTRPIQINRYQIESYEPPDRGRLVVFPAKSGDCAQIVPDFSGSLSPFSPFTAFLTCSG